MRVFYKVKLMGPDVYVQYVFNVFTDHALYISLQLDGYIGKPVSR